MSKVNIRALRKSCGSFEALRQVADRVIIMEGGEVIETGPPDEVHGASREARTRNFLSAVLNH